MKKNIPYLLLPNWLWLTFLLMIALNVSVNAQDIEQAINQVKSLKDAPKKLLETGIKVNGSVASTSNYFDSKLVEFGKIPFESYLNGSINFDFFGKVKMPFTFNLNTQGVRFTHPFDQKFRYRQPFNIMQFRPSYKGIELILGSGAASFSPLTVNGHRYEGLGIVVQNSKIPISFKFMTGTLLKSIQKDSLNPTILPSYKRMGIGGLIGFKQKQHTAELILFRAGDQATGASFENLDVYQISPQQNAVVGFKGATVFAKVLEAKIETAFSGLTLDRRTEIPALNTTTWKNFGGLLEINSSTIYKKAINAELNLKAKTYTLGLGYNHVDPEYRTLGAYYFTNDLENISAQLATQLFEQKLSVMAKLGRQRDNLDNSKSQSLSQWVGMANLAFVPSEELNLTFAYSNYRSFTNLRTDLDYLTAIVPYNALDTLNFRQINQNLTANILGILPSSSEDIQKSISATMVFQQSADKQGGYNNGSNVANGSISYALSKKEPQTALNIGINVGRNDYLIVNDWLVGPTFSYGTSLLNKQVKTSTAATYLRTWGSTKETSGILNLRFGANYTLKEKHRFGLITQFMHRQVAEILPVDKDFWQFMASLSYQYSFELLNLSKKKNDDKK